MSTYAIPAGCLWLFSFLRAREPLALADLPLRRKRGFQRSRLHGSYPHCDLRLCITELELEFSHSRSEASYSISAPCSSLTAPCSLPDPSLME